MTTTKWTGPGAPRLRLSGEDGPARPGHGAPEHIRYDRAVTLEQLHEAVGGYIQSVPHFHYLPDGRRCVAFCNDEGKLDGLPRNHAATALWEAQVESLMGDYLVGPVIVLTGDDEFMQAV